MRWKHLSKDLEAAALQDLHPNRGARATVAGDYDHDNRMQFVSKIKAAAASFFDPSYGKSVHAVTSQRGGSVQLP
ncbi:MAG: hypothetical protein OEM85_10350 [Gammaproteobacteria bacterium]|nr:hypothetical protein [Gammaproteobacteria bacterium]